MAVIEPDLNTLMRVELFDDNVGGVIVINVDGCDDNRRVTRVDREQAYRPAGSADSYTECILATVTSETPQRHAVWLLVVVEIHNDESLAELPAGEVAANGLDR